MVDTNTQQPQDLADKVAQAQEEQDQFKGSQGNNDTAANPLSMSPRDQDSMGGTGDQYQTSQRFHVQTEKGLVNKEQVNVLKQQNFTLDAPVINYISTNQSHEYFAVGTKTGFEIIQNNSASDKLLKKIQNLGESVEIIEMMYKTNFIVLVMSSARNKVIIWDDHERKNRSELTFFTEIKAIKLRKDMLIVVQDKKTFIFNFATLKLIEQVETCANPLGLCSVSSAEKPITRTICLPGLQKGQLKILNYVVDKSIGINIQAHDQDIGALAVNPDGTLIASASQKGTLIKIFSSDGGETLQTLRRGSGSAEITSIAFHPSRNMIACTSNRPSIHIFEIKKSIEKCIETKQYGFSNTDVAKNTDGENKKPGLSFLKGVSKYFDCDLCLSKIKIDDKFKTIAFDAKNHRLSVMTYDRVVYFCDIPAETTRYMSQAEVRIF